MDNGHRILSGLLTIAVIVILLMRSCGGGHTSGEVIYRDTVINELTVDTIWLPVKDTVYTYIDVKIPKPYFDTMTVYDTVKRYTIEDFDDFIERPQIYEDTISNDTVSIHYNATIWGYMEDMNVGYRLDKQYTIVETRTLETEVTKVKQSLGLYIGMDVAANADGITHLAPMLSLVMHKMSLDGGYDLNDQSFVLGAKWRISFRKKAKYIPRP